VNCHPRQRSQSSVYQYTLSRAGVNPTSCTGSSNMTYPRTVDELLRNDNSTGSNVGTTSSRLQLYRAKPQLIHGQSGRQGDRLQTMTLDLKLAASTSGDDPQYPLFDCNRDLLRLV
jgi:hypothetical protein